MGNAFLRDEALEVSAWLEAGQGFFQGAWSSHSMTCLKAFQQALLLEPENGWIHFRLGVVYGRLFDEDPSPTHAVFAQGHLALRKQALALDPNQYIWRRRLQQYGPRLDKPYAFMTGSMRRDRNCWHVVRLLYL